MVARLEDVGARCGEHRADRNAATERLGDGHHVGHRLLVLMRPPPPGPSHPRLDLVEDEQDVALVAEPPDLGEPAGLERDDAALALDRLEHDGARRGVDRRLERADVVVRHVHEPFRERLERLAIARVRRGGERAQRASVERALRADDHVRRRRDAASPTCARA